MAGNILNIGEFAQPIDRLIEKTSEAIGGYLRPWQTIRVARAEADAKIVHARADLKIRNLEDRAANRSRREETLKQANMEKIVANAAGDLSADSKPESMSNDWLLNFFDKARLISESEMQAIWGRLLASEANAPGTFSKRTINILASMDYREAKAFSDLCRLVWKIGDQATPVLFEFDDNAASSAGVSLESAQDLMGAGLISMSVGFGSGFSIGDIKDSDRLVYRDSTYRVAKWQNVSKSEIPVGIILFTSSGAELASICNVEAIDGFEDEVLAKWNSRAIEVEKIS